MSPNGVDRVGALNEGIMSELVDGCEGWVGGGYGWLRHGFSTRAGGVSSVYGGNSLNLGWTKEDEPGLVAENRRRFLRSVGGDLRG